MRRGSASSYWRAGDYVALLRYRNAQKFVSALLIEAETVGSTCLVGSPRVLRWWSSCLIVYERKSLVVLPCGLVDATQTSRDIQLGYTHISDFHERNSRSFMTLGPPPFQLLAVFLLLVHPQGVLNLIKMSKSLGRHLLGARANTFGKDTPPLGDLLEAYRNGSCNSECVNEMRLRVRLAYLDVTSMVNFISIGSRASYNAIVIKSNPSSLDDSTSLAVAGGVVFLAALGFLFYLRARGHCRTKTEEPKSTRDIELANIPAISTRMLPIVVDVQTQEQSPSITDCEAKESPTSTTGSSSSWERNSMPSPGLSTRHDEFGLLTTGVGTLANPFRSDKDDAAESHICFTSAALWGSWNHIGALNSDSTSHVGSSPLEETPVSHSTE